MKQQFYIVTGEFPYEGGTPIGVYSSYEAARSAIGDYRKTADVFQYPHFNITSLVLDASVNLNAETSHL